MLEEHAVASIAELGYLAGIIDGEGMIGIYRQPHGTMTRVSVSNTNSTIIERVREIMVKIGVSPHIYLVKKQDGKRKDCWEIMVTSQVSCRKVLETVMPYLCGKKAQAQLLLDYVISRHGKKARYGLSPEEERMISSMRPLNRRGI